jgi:hypothetical protein
MRRTLFLAAIILSAYLAVGMDQHPRKRAIPCKTPAIANSCYWAHGRLSFYNGTPAFRLWPTATHHLFGIYSGPSVGIHHNDNEDNEHPEFPSNVSRKFNPLKNRIFADFEVCPLEPERPGAMQAACIESAKNIVVEPF